MRAYNWWFTAKNPQYVKDDDAAIAEFAKKLGATVKGVSKLEFYQEFCVADPSQ